MPVTDYSYGQYYDPASGQTVSPDEGTGMPGSTSDGPYKFSGIKYGSSNKWGNQALGDAEQYYQRLQSGQDSYAQAMARAKLGQAQQSMAAQAVGRGANPMAERAAIMGGGQAMRQGMVEASAIRAQEMAAAQQAYQNALNTRIGQQQNWAQMELARQQAEADSYYKGREVEMAEDKASQERTSGYINMAGSVVGAVAGGMMSDARLKEDIRSAGADPMLREAAFAAYRQRSEQASDFRTDPPYPAERARNNSEAMSTRVGRAGRAGSLQAQTEHYQDDPEIVAAYRAMQDERRDGPARRNFAPIGSGRTGTEQPADFSPIGLGKHGEAWGGTHDDYHRGGRPAPTPPPTLGEIIRRKVEEKRAAAEQDATARSLALYQYRYRPDAAAASGTTPDQERVGVMAQDLASTPIGAHAVQQTGAGLMIDPQQAIGLSLGLNGRMGQRADELEARLAAVEARIAARRGR
jgi:hypothetical protein